MTLTQQEIVLKNLLMKELGVAQKHDPASLTLASPALHGPLQGNANQFGLFADPYSRPARWSTVPRPPSGIFQLATLRRSEFVKERLDLMSGVTAAAGTNATGWCGDPPTVGQGKIASLDYEFGEYFIKTNLKAIPLIGQVRRGEVPANILNAAPENRNPLIPSMMYVLGDGFSQLQYELWLIGVHLGITVDSVGITGDHSQASNATEVGWISEFDGLDRQIRTGITDARTGIAVPAADSWVIPFNGDIGGTNATYGNFVTAMSEAYFTVKDRAETFGMPGVQLAIMMRKEAWRSTVENWACNYATYRCLSGTAGQPVLNDARDMNQLRLEMMNGKYLLIDGEAVPVVFSEGIPFTSQGGGLFTSDMYIVPYMWEGIPLLVFEYFPMDNQALTEWVGFVGNGMGDGIQTMNNGLWIATSQQARFCREYLLGMRGRLVLETPWLAARVDDVQWRNRTGIRVANPGNSFSYFDGGVSYVAADTNY